MNTNCIYNESCLDTLKKMPDSFIDCVITSPPYWQLRDYGYPEQWGLEPTFQEYLEHLWQMIDEIYRVLKPTGTVWINLGDTYNSGGNNRSNKNEQTEGLINHQYLKNTGFTKTDVKLNGKPKCLMLIPHRFAIGCIDRGWIVRNDIIWAKRNGMPESVTDRFTKKHEYIFFMAKQEKYFFDLDAIRDSIKIASIERYQYEFSGNKADIDRKFIGTPSGKIKNKYSNIENEATHRQGMHQERGNSIIEKRPNLPTHNEFVNFIRSRTNIDTLCNSINLPKTKVEHWFRKDINGFSYPSNNDWNLIKEFIDNWDNEFLEIDKKMTYCIFENDDINKNMYKGKNPGSVSDFWDVTTKGTTAEHYAAYNDELIKKPILAGCPEGGIIYDPFMGTGSTAEAALRANRKFIGSEMSSKYCDIANKRLKPYLQQQNLFE
jgi:DNA modification methylase